MECKRQNLSFTVRLASAESMSCFVVWCVILCTSFLVDVNATDEHPQCEAREYRRIKLLKDHIATAQPIWEREEFFAVKCAEMCSKDEHCMSFFHNSFTGSCQAQNLSFTNPYGMNHSDGFQYYRFYPKGFRLSNCAEIGAYYNYGSKHNGVHTATLPDGPFQVYCEFPANSGRRAWTVIQNRYDGSESFDRTWNEYKKGFGDLDKEFWLGNEKIWRMTREALVLLLIQIMDFENTKSKAYYHRFSVGNSSVYYALQFGWYNGNAGNGLEYHKGRPFSARDLDLDASSTHCADLSGGGWWYGACYEVNLNGLYSTAGGNLSWLSLHPLKRTQMKITTYI